MCSMDLLRFFKGISLGTHSEPELKEHSEPNAQRTSQNVSPIVSQKVPRTLLIDQELLISAFTELYPERKIPGSLIVRYSGKVRGYNARVRYSPSVLDFHLSAQWKAVSPEIKKGLLQSLLLKLFKKKTSTLYTQLYDGFLRNVHIAIPKEDVEPFLLEQFRVLNEQYFNGLLDMPNLVWGVYSTRKLGSYEYAKDRITISTVLKDAPLELLQFVLYHEMLHKKHKFTTKEGRCYHHTPEFKREEQQFSTYTGVEERLQRFLSQKKRRRFTTL